MNLSTKYLGLELKNPLIVGASNLVTDIEMLKSLEAAGASAIVYKSLFEEQIQLENLELQQRMNEYNERNAEMVNLFPQKIYEIGPEEFLLNFSKAKKALTIPLIASLNAVYDETWGAYAQKLEAAGAAALEVNFYAAPTDFDADGRGVILEELDVIENIKKNVSIPVSVKLSPFYTNPLYVIAEMDKKGVDGFVLFNRLFQPDINIETEKHHFPYNLSHEHDNRIALRFAGLLYGQINGNICANTGVFTGADAIKMILAGADAVQIVSTIYKNGPKQITRMIEEMELWMAARNYNSIDDFKGKLSRKNAKDPLTYRRAQYVDILMKSDEIFKTYPLR